MVLVLPARGLTFLHDDWALLSRFVHVPWPLRWLQAHNEHWVPLRCALFELELAAFGRNHTFFLLVTWAVHVANVFLLARVLAHTTRDARAGALAALAFGISTAHRDVLWWVDCTGIACVLAASLLALLALERLRATEAVGWVVALGALAFAAPCLHGFGIALAPALAVGGALIVPRRRRLAATLVPLAALAAYLLLRHATVGPLGGGLPRSAEDAARAAGFLVASVGFGALREPLLVPAPVEFGSGATLAFVYVVLAAAAVLASDSDQRRRLAVGHAFWIALLVSSGLVRWSFPFGVTVFSRYQYLPALAWTLTLALLVAAGLRRRPSASLAASAVALALLALGHSRTARDDVRLSAPAQRREHLPFVVRLVARTSAARGPVYDPPLPFGFAAFMPLRVHDVVDSIAPLSSVAWTVERSPATVEPYAGDPLLRPLAAF